MLKVSLQNSTSLDGFRVFGFRVLQYGAFGFQGLHTVALPCMPEPLLQPGFGATG